MRHAGSVPVHVRGSAGQSTGVRSSVRSELVVAAPSPGLCSIRERRPRRRTPGRGLASSALVPHRRGEVLGGRGGGDDDPRADRDADRYREARRHVWCDRFPRQARDKHRETCQVVKVSGRGCAIPVPVIVFNGICFFRGLASPGVLRCGDPLLVSDVKYSTFVLFCQHRREPLHHGDNLLSVEV